MNKFLTLILLVILSFTSEGNVKYINLELWTEKKQLDCLSITVENGIVNGIYYGSYRSGNENYYFKVMFHSYYQFHDVKRFRFTDVYTSSSIEGLRDSSGSIHFGVWSDFKNSDFDIDILEFFPECVKVYNRITEIHSSNLSIHPTNPI